MKLSSERHKTFLLFLDLSSNLQIITFLTKNWRKLLKEFLTKKELEELMMKKSLTLELDTSFKITMMNPDISLTKMTRIPVMKKLTSLLMYEKQKSLQLTKVYNDQTPKNLKIPQRLILMSTKQKLLMIFLAFQMKRIDLLKKTSLLCP